MTLAVLCVDAALVGLGVAAFFLVDRQVRPAPAEASILNGDNMSKSARDLLRNVPANDIDRETDVGFSVKTII